MVMAGQLANQSYVVLGKDNPPVGTPLSLAQAIKINTYTQTLEYKYSHPSSNSPNISSPKPSDQTSNSGVIGGVTKDIGQGITNLGGSVADVISALENALIKPVTSGVNDVTTSGSNVIQSASNDVGSLIKTTGDTAGAVATDVGKAGGDLLGGLSIPLIAVGAIALLVLLKK